MNKITAAITAVGAYVPDYVLSNEILETMVDTNDEWITTRTGIKERRLLKKEGEGTSYLAIKAPFFTQNSFIITHWYNPYFDDSTKSLTDGTFILWTPER